MTSCRLAADKNDVHLFTVTVDEEAVKLLFHATARGTLCQRYAGRVFIVIVSLLASGRLHLGCANGHQSFLMLSLRGSERSLVSDEVVHPVCHHGHNVDGSAKVGASSASDRSAFRDLAVDNAHGIIPPCQRVNGTCSIKGGSSFRCTRDA